jgi:hypothetical protein
VYIHVIYTHIRTHTYIYIIITIITIITIIIVIIVIVIIIIIVIIVFIYTCYFMFAFLNYNCVFFLYATHFLVSRRSSSTFAPKRSDDSVKERSQRSLPTLMSAQMAGKA